MGLPAATMPKLPRSPARTTKLTMRKTEEEEAAQVEELEEHITEIVAALEADNECTD